MDHIAASHGSCVAARGHDPTHELADHHEKLQAKTSVHGRGSSHGSCVCDLRGVSYWTVISVCPNVNRLQAQQLCGPNDPQCEWWNTLRHGLEHAFADEASGNDARPDGDAAVLDERLRQAWDTINKPKQRDLQWSPEQTKAFWTGSPQKGYGIWDAWLPEDFSVEQDWDA